LIFVLSFLLPFVSVHNYCENRVVAAFFGLISLTVLLLFLRNQAASSSARTRAIIGGVVCFLSIAVNVAFSAVER
jgi:drug/metabolite transporter superfamily protein YnfA